MDLFSVSWKSFAVYLKLAIKGGEGGGESQVSSWLFFHARLLFVSRHVKKEYHAHIFYLCATLISLQNALLLVCVLGFLGIFVP